MTHSSRENPPPGVLYVVATPIGNLADITYRAVEVLQSADLIAAEDTRHTSRLLSRYQITTRLVSCHEHNETQMAETLVARLRSGASVALVSDAGTPAISDPGYRVVSAALAEGIRVVPVPGPSAVEAALSVSGLPSDRFCFTGFLPKKVGPRKDMIKDLARAEQTLIMYESPRRLIGLLKELLAHLGDRQAVIGREMTKRYEEFLRGSISELIAELEARHTVKGEITVLISGKAPISGNAEQIPGNLIEEIREALSTQQTSPSRLAAALARKHGVARNSVYQLILRCQAEK